MFPNASNVVIGVELNKLKFSGAELKELESACAVSTFYI